MCMRRTRTFATLTKLPTLEAKQVQVEGRRGKATPPSPIAISNSSGQQQQQTLTHNCVNIDGLSECYYLMGEVHRFKALVEKKGSTARESEQNACITCVNKAIELYQYVDQQRLYTRMCQYTRHSSHTLRTATQQTCPGA